MEFVKKTLNEMKELLEKQEVLKKEILTIEEAAGFLDLSTSRLYKMTHNKEIPHYKPGGKKIYLKRQELEQWILNSRIASTNDLDVELESYLSRTNKNVQS